jgi:hypothetical protein
MTPAELETWAKERGGVPRQLSKQRCRVVRLGVPAADGLVCTERVPRQDQWDNGSEHYRLWRHDGRKLAEVWKGPRTYGDLAEVVLKLSPQGESFTLLEPAPLRCRAAEEAAEQQIEIGDPQIPRTVAEICNRRGQYVWSSGHFIRAPNSWDCFTDFACAVGNDQWPANDGVPSTPRPADAPGAPRELSRPELEAWSALRGGVTPGLLQQRCRAVRLGSPASDGLVCTVRVNGTEDWYQMWRYDGLHLVKVWEGPRTLGSRIEVALQMAPDADGFTLVETRPGVCNAEYLAAEKRIAAVDDELMNVTGICGQMGSYVWSGKRFTRDARARPAALAFLPSIARSPRTPTSQAPELSAAELEAWSKARGGAPRALLKQRCRPARLGVPAADGLVCTELDAKQNQWDDGSEHYQLWRYDGHRLNLVWKGPHTFGRYVDVELSLAEDGGKFSLLEPRPVVCPLLRMVADQTEDKAIYTPIVEICDGRGPYVWSKGKFVHEIVACLGAAPECAMPSGK